MLGGNITSGHAIHPLPTTLPTHTAVAQGEKNDPVSHIRPKTWPRHAPVNRCEKAINVSHYQKENNFTKIVAQGVKSAVLRVADGLDPDVTFVPNYKAACAAGCKTLAYHCFQPKSDPAAQRDTIVKTLESTHFDGSQSSLYVSAQCIHPGDRVYDEKVESKKIAQDLHDLLTLVEKEAILKGNPPGIYCDPQVWDERGIGDEGSYDFSKYRLWVKQWGEGVEAPRIPITWNKAGKSWDIYQFSDQGQVDGIGGDSVCLNWIRG